MKKFALPSLVSAAAVAACYLAFFAAPALAIPPECQPDGYVCHVDGGQIGGCSSFIDECDCLGVNGKWNEDEHECLQH